MDGSNNSRSRPYGVVSRTETSLRLLTPEKKHYTYPDRENRRQWVEVWDEMLKFLNVRRTCVINRSTTPIIITDSETENSDLEDYTSEELASDYVSPGDFASKNSSSQLASSKGSRCHLICLPNEIFHQIFDETVDPYIMNGTCYQLIQPLYDIRCHVVFHRPRDWADMNVFHICQRFRKLAIASYGEPDYFTIPFNPRLDFVSIRPQQFPSVPPRRLSYLLISHDEEDGGGSWTIRQANFACQDQRHNGADGFFFGRSSEISANPHRKFLRLPLNLRLRIYQLEIVPPIGNFTLECVLTTLDSNLPNTRCVRLKVPRFDSCSHRQKIARLDSGKWELRQYHSVVTNYKILKFSPGGQDFDPFLFDPLDPGAMGTALRAVTEHTFQPRILWTDQLSMLRLVWQWLHPDTHLTHRMDVPGFPSLRGNMHHRFKNIKIIELLTEDSVCTDSCLSAGAFKINVPHSSGAPEWETWVQILGS